MRASSIKLNSLNSYCNWNIMIIIICPLQFTETIDAEQIVFVDTLDMAGVFCKVTIHDDLCRHEKRQKLSANLFWWSKNVNILSQYAFKAFMPSKQNIKLAVMFNVDRIKINYHNNHTLEERYFSFNHINTCGQLWPYPQIKV